MKCGAAYSMVRGLLSTYSGPLYQVRSGSSATNTGTGGMTKDIGMLADGYADAAAQDAFCMGTVCTVSKLYDQTGNANDLIRGSAGPTGNGTRSGNDDYESTATKLSVTAGGHKVYALYMQQYEGYRTALGVTGKGLPMGNKDQGIYELVDGTHFGTQCCWDFGSVSPNPKTYVTMNTLFLGTGFWGKGAGNGPWFMGDFEGGVWAGGTGASTVTNSMSPSITWPFALGILHTPVGKYAIRMANVQSATDLTTAYDGGIPSGKTWGNAGGIALGIGGDNSNNSFGTFYEGALTNGAPSNATDLLIMKNIQAVGYKK
jgi:non-reducing end alpha-L-arabinofuranosidase